MLGNNNFSISAAHSRNSDATAKWEMSRIVIEWLELEETLKII